MRELGYGEQRGGRFRTLLACLLILAGALVVSGCKQVQGALHSGRQQAAAPPGERLIAYEQGGNIWTIRATGDGAQQISKSGSLMLGPWSPDDARMSVLTAVNHNGEWATGNAGVLDLSGNIKPVIGTQGAVAIEPGEVSWLDGNSLVLGGQGAILVARPDGAQYRATPLYTARQENGEQVWHPRVVPGGTYVSFWITNAEGKEGDVKARLVITPAGGGKLDTIFSQKILASGQAPVDAVWSPDAHYVLVYAESGGGNPWWLLDRTRGAKQAVLSADAGNVQWLPGNQLLYAPQAVLQVPKYELLDVASGKSKPFADIPDWTNWLQVAADNRLLLARTTGDENIRWDYYVAAADGTGAKKIAGGAGDAYWQP